MTSCYATGRHLALAPSGHVAGTCGIGFALQQSPQLLENGVPQVMRHIDGNICLLKTSNAAGQGVNPLHLQVP